MGGKKIGVYEGFVVVCLALAVAANGAEFFAAPNGSPAGYGSITTPWNLQTALEQPPEVLPGDIIWLRDGVYRTGDQHTRYSSSLAGAEDLPIIVRQYPGERAVIDGNLIQQSGGWVHYQGFEIMNTHSNRLTTEAGSFPTAFYLPFGEQIVDWAVSGVDLRVPNVKLINLLIHDSIGGGISVSAGALNRQRVYRQLHV